MESKSGFPVYHVIYLTSVKPGGARSSVVVNWHGHFDFSEGMPICFGWGFGLGGCCSIL